MADEHPDAKYDCCKHQSNRELVSLEINSKNKNEHAKHETCKVCGRSHHELTVDKAHIGMKVT